METYIYLIHCIADPMGHVYVGKADNPHERLFQHIGGTHHVYRRGYRKSKKCQWIWKWLPHGIELVVLEKVPEDGWKQAEGYWMEYWRYIGAELLNEAPAGLGGRSGKRRSGPHGETHSVLRTMSNMRKSRRLERRKPAAEKSVPTFVG